MPVSVRQVLAALLALLTAVAPAAAQDNAPTAPRPAEFMIYQYPDVALVVIVDTKEAEFIARVSGPEGALLTEAGVADRRIGPVWLYVDSTDRPRQLMVHVQPTRPVARSAIGMELMQLSMDDVNARRQAQAYRLLAHGMQRAYADDTSTWAQRGQSLSQAARAFAALGMERMRLWADFYRAHLALHRLDDVLTSLELAAGVERAARRAGFDDIALANDVLVAEALLRGARKSSGASVADYYGRAHDALAALAERAGASGFAGEQALALYRDGQAWDEQGDAARAVARYEESLAVAAGTGDTELLNRVRATAAAAYEQQGRTSGAISLLDDIAGDLPAGAGADPDRAETLYEKGRLLNRAYRHAEAAPVLAQALSLQQDDPSVSQWGRTGIELGRSLHALGDLREARHVLLAALPRASGVDAAARAAAHGMLADIARFEGRYDEMAERRARQAALAGRSSAAQTFAASLDAAARPDAVAADVARRFGQAADRAAADGAARMQRRAELYTCLYSLRAAGACDAGRAKAARDDLLRSGIPRDAADARLVYAQIMHREGRRRAAAREIETLLNELRFYREVLPGTLGAWGWARRADVYHEHMALALNRDAAGDGSHALLALEQLRWLERAQPGADLHEALRNRIADLDRRADLPSSARRVVDDTDALRADFARHAGLPDRGRLDRALAGLERDETLLAWYFAERETFLLAAGRGGVRRYRLGAPAALLDPIESLRQVLPAADRVVPTGLLDRLGAALLQPVAGSLGERTYVLALGPVTGIPFDALRLDGRFLAERSAVVHLESVAALARRQPVLTDGFGDAVFVAGNPRTGADPFSYEVRPSPEIDAVGARFVGAGLHIVQGIALDREEFDDARFADARLLHLAMPGRIDLAEPDRSRFQVAGGGFLAADELRAFRLAAGLAVLSNTAVEGETRTPFDGRVGLVADLHAAGVGTVVASLWPTEERVVAGLVSDFYARLGADGDVIGAFVAARRARIDAADPANLRSWAGFQLFIR